MPTILYRYNHASNTAFDGSSIYPVELRRRNGEYERVKLLGFKPYGEVVAGGVSFGKIRALEVSRVTGRYLTDESWVTVKQSQHVLVMITSRQDTYVGFGVYAMLDNTGLPIII